MRPSRNALSCPAIAPLGVPRLALPVPRRRSSRSPVRRRGCSQAPAGRLQVRSTAVRRQAAADLRAVAHRASAPCFLNAQVKPIGARSARKAAGPGLRTPPHMLSRGQAGASEAGEMPAFASRLSDEAVVLAHVVAALCNVHDAGSDALARAESPSSARPHRSCQVVRASFPVDVIAVLPGNCSRAQLLRILSAQVPPARGCLYRFVSGSDALRACFADAECGVSWGRDVIALASSTKARRRLASIQQKIASLGSDEFVEAWLAKSPGAGVISLFSEFATFLGLSADMTLKSARRVECVNQKGSSWSHRHLLEAIADFDPDAIADTSAAIVTLGHFLSDLHLAPAVVEGSAPLCLVVDAWAPIAVRVLSERRVRAKRSVSS